MGLIYIGYAWSKDAALAQELEDQLAPLNTSESHVIIWSERKVLPGDTTDREVDEHLNRAQIIVMIITASFLADERCQRLIRSALQRQQAGFVRLAPVLADFCLWDQSALGGLNPLPDRYRPVRNFANRNEAWHLVVRGIIELISVGEVTCSIAESSSPQREAVKNSSSRSGRHELSVNRLVELRAQHIPGRTDASLPPLSTDALTIKDLLRVLPVATRDLVGRENELRYLDSCYVDPNIRVVVLVGFGGVGKTALVRHWIEIRFSDCPGVLLLGCSFYSQGTHEQCGSSDQFLYEALAALGDQSPGKGSLWGRGRRLARYVSERNITVVLDGLEPLQHGPNCQGFDGTVRDPGISEFLKCMVTEATGGFCLLTTRVALADSFLRTPVVRHRPLEVLTPDASEELLRTHGIHGETRTLRRVAQHLGYHSLALVLACELARTFYNGEVAEILQLPLVDERIRAGRHAKTIMAAYESTMRREQFFLGIELLYFLGLFDRPAAMSWLSTLHRGPPISGFLKLPTASTEEILAALAQLHRWKLITGDGGEFIDTHPLIREYFGKRLRSISPKGWQEANASLFLHFASICAERPRTIQDMEPALQAVIHGCHAGMAERALREVLLPKIMRDRECYATSRLGLNGPVLAALMHFFSMQDVDRLSQEEIIRPIGLSDLDSLFILLQSTKCLVALRGYSAPPVGAFGENSLRLAQYVGNHEAAFEAQYCLWRFLIARGCIDDSADIGRKLLQMAISPRNVPLMLAAYRALATTQFWRGEISECEQHALNGATLIGEVKGRIPSWLGDNPGHICRINQSLCCILRGKTKESLSLVQSVLNDARDYGDPHNLGIVFFLSGYVIDLTGDLAAAHRHAEELVALSMEFGFRWLGAGLIRIGWSTAMLEPEGLRGERELLEGIGIWQGASAGVSMPYWKARHADLLRQHRRTKEALQAIEQGMGIMQMTNERWFESELLRMKGELLIQEGNDDKEVVQILDAARKVAARRGAYIFELRAGLSLANALRNQGHAKEAVTMLRELLAKGDLEVDCIDVQHVWSWLSEHAGEHPDSDSFFFAPQDLQGGTAAATPTVVDSNWPWPMGTKE